MRRAAKTDANQQQVVKDLRKLGFSVAVTSSLGKGFPDLVLGKANKNYLVELKDGNKPPSARKLTPDEEVFIDGWRGRVIVAISTEDILNQI
jgi:Holliday junction resolvase